MTLNTGYTRSVAERLVDTLSLRDHIDGLVVAEDVGFGRPYPYMIHHLMKQFKVSLTRSLTHLNATQPLTRTFNSGTQCKESCEGGRHSERHGGRYQRVLWLGDWGAVGSR